MTSIERPSEGECWRGKIMFPDIRNCIILQLCVLTFFTFSPSAHLYHHYAEPATSKIRCVSYGGGIQTAPSGIRKNSTATNRWCPTPRNMPRNGRNHLNTFSVTNVSKVSCPSSPPHLLSSSLPSFPPPLFLPRVHLATSHPSWK